MFKDRKLIIATKHGKERVIAPLVENSLGVRCITNDAFDTDTLGTFSGEVERKNDPITTARKKCLMAMELCNCDLGISSEGSFGAHPSIPFGSANEEFVMFIDLKNNLEIVGKSLSLETNFNGKEVHSETELLDFATRAQFPSHALILRGSKTDTDNLFKGITDLQQLKAHFQSIHEKLGHVFVETDMRAMFNPLRMKVIKEATKKLIEKIDSHCPSCHIPGFDVVTVKPGLPCGLCNSPTASTLSLVYRCKHCGYENESMYPNKKTEEDPAYCQYCNP